MATQHRPESLSSSLRRRWVKRALLVVLSVVVTAAIFHLVGRIDWPVVWDALAQMTWWQLALLLALLGVRQGLNSVPLALYTPDLGIQRAAMNDMGAMTMACVAPPPSDMALRISMFNSWGVPTAMGLAGTVMNMLTFYIVRFATPIGGVVLLLIYGGTLGIRLLDLISIVAAVALFVGVLLVVRSDALARRLGSGAGRVARKVRRRVDPAAWATACAKFRNDIADRFYRAFPKALLSQVAMIATDLAMVVLCLRFVGVSAEEVGLGDIAIAYLFAYPMTILVFSGIGVVDALIVAGLVEAGGPAVEAPAVAALIVWRVFTVGGPILLGAGSIALWRRSTATAGRASA